MIDTEVVTEGLVAAVRFDMASVRSDFPTLLHQTVSDGCPLVYLDSAATSLKPDAVVRTARSQISPITRPMSIAVCTR